jgi:hypothetical protein
LAIVKKAVENLNMNYGSGCIFLSLVFLANGILEINKGTWDEISAGILAIISAGILVLMAKKGRP